MRVVSIAVTNPVSAILTYNHLIVGYFLCFSHFTPHNFLSIMAFKGHGSFISGVTDAVWQSALGLVRGVRVKRARSAAHAHRFYDGLAEAVGGSFVWKRAIIIRVVWGSGSFFATNLFQIRFSK